MHAPHVRIIGIDRGNGLIARYAHASRLNVEAGSLVVRRQGIATVGTTGRSTSPHLQFEGRQSGMPQTPARFLQAAG